MKLPSIITYNARLDHPIISAITNIKGLGWTIMFVLGFALLIIKTAQAI